MNTIYTFFQTADPIHAALVATLFTWFVTLMGASLVFFFDTMSRRILDTMLGFTEV
jgi:ZIP family zinc transporter